ncbi:reverse transcriptase (RNA-dependent DNA polymerase) domain-containing protein [Phthorimaea operculella]|nr:reverse transcriptase (RNA-dependent DNA polymerase) domain-containing protein [Phthorimaea operculella]
MMGFTPRLIKLFSNYLKDRKQYVKYGPYVSNDYNTRSGISQGSNLGPLLFVLLINDLPDVVSNSSILIFADDVKLYKTCESEYDCKLLQKDLDAVYAWSISNKLWFNPLKCETTTFTRSSVPLGFSYSIGGVPVSRVQQVRDLGVLFDPALTFHAHAQRVAEAARRRLGFVLRNAGPLSPAATQALYSALVRSLLETSSVVWSPHEDNYILLLERIQKQFLRALYKKLFTRYPFMYPTNFLMGQLGYQSLEVRRAVALVKFVLNVIRHKIDSIDLVEVFTRLSVPNMRAMTSLRPRYRALLAQERARTVARRQAPAARARTVIDAVLEAAPHCDLFATGMGCLMIECNRVCETRYARASTIIN